MRSTTILLAITAVASALPSAIIPQAAPDLASSVIQNLTVLAEDSRVSNQSINAQPPGNQAYTGAQAITIANASFKIVRDLNSTAATVNQSAIFTQAESQQIYNKLNNELKPIVFSVADNTIAHYPNFKAGGLASSAATEIKQQKELARELANALIAKVVPPYKTMGTSLRDAILAKYDSMIAKFST